MGAWIRNNFINISDETRKGVLVGGFSYKDIDDKFISEICSNDKIQVIQISKALPKEAFIKIDSILEKKPELDFRIFSITSLNRCDISFLENMPHLRRLRIDCHLRDWENGLDFNVLTKLKYDVEHQTFMGRPCDARAGYKHHLTPSYLIYLKRSLMDICHREHLHQVDLLSPAEKKITDREYRAKHTGQKKLDALNKEMLSKGIAPRKTVFQTQKEYLRTAIAYAAASSCNMEEFQATLLKNYQITLKVSRGRFSYLHPERNKFITGRSLGSHYTEDYLFSIWEKKKEPQNQSHTRSDIFTPHSNSTTSAFTEEKETEAFYFIKSDLRLVIDLQQRVKAQRNPVYDRKVKLSNLQQMAKTIAYVQERGYSTEDDLMIALTTSQSETANCRKNLRSTQQELKRINEQIHYTGQYLANKSVYREFLHAKNKKQFRQEHLSEITLYETARNFLKQQTASEKLPSMKLLKSEKEKLLSIKNMQHQEYQKRKQYEKELQTVYKNVEMILHGRSDFEKSSEKNLPPR